MMNRPLDPCRSHGLDRRSFLLAFVIGMTSSGVAALAEAAQERSWLTIGNNRLGRHPDRIRSMVESGASPKDSELLEAWSAGGDG